MRGCSWGACVVAPGEACVVAPGEACMVVLGGVRGCSGGHAWLLWGACMVALGGHAWLLRGACVVALGGHAWLLGGACVVALGGHAWLLRGEVCGCSQGGARGCSGGMVAPGGGVRGIRRDTEIRSMSGRYASYWNAFLLI